MSEANKKQVAGSHYRKGGQFQHWDLITHKYGRGYLIGCATKYLTRWREKNVYTGFQRFWCFLVGVRLPTPEDDLRKAQHYAEKLAEFSKNPPAVFDYQTWLRANGINADDEFAIRKLLEAESSIQYKRAAEVIEQLAFQVKK
ncbi:gp26 [Alphaproteobacteria phage PhiJL001]|uniref:Gp26 n=1 Tax=Alphaproteobacteria phage PhiJL001 TaxID=2681607 RepID=Q5DN79_9CAUD|nr:gp26 [Alphaproteobacteria phage PhiJL001]AAT69502.1 gp26 [Alphaproteobacteria phage PhiJL001]